MHLKRLLIQLIPTKAFSLPGHTLPLPNQEKQDSLMLHQSQPVYVLQEPTHPDLHIQIPLLRLFLLNRSLVLILPVIFLPLYFLLVYSPQQTATFLLSLPILPVPVFLSSQVFLSPQVVLLIRPASLFLPVLFQSVLPPVPLVLLLAVLLTAL